MAVIKKFRIKSFKKQVGLVLNPNISENKIFPYLKKIDLYLC